MHVSTGHYDVIESARKRHVRVVTLDSMFCIQYQYRLIEPAELVKFQRFD